MEEAEAGEEAADADSPLIRMSPNISPPSLLLPAPLWEGDKVFINCFQPDGKIAMRSL